MALLLVGRSQCGICKATIDTEAEAVGFLPFVANVLDPLLLFHDGVFHRRCVTAHPLGAEAWYWSRSRGYPYSCDVCGSAIKDPDEILPTSYLTRDPSSPLFAFNKMMFHTTCVRRWGRRSEMLRALGDAIRKKTMAGTGITWLARMVWGQPPLYPCDGVHSEVSMSPNKGVPMFPTKEARGVPSPFRRLLLTDVWDGPMSGLAIDARGAVFAFEFLDWDDKHSMRVFRLAAVRDVHWSELEAALPACDLKDGESWVLPVPLPPEADALVTRAAAVKGTLAVIATKDILDSIDVWRPIMGPIAPPELDRWLEELGLRRRV